MRLLVTGGFGFIGSHVLGRLVDDGHEVACLDLRGPSAVARPVADDVTAVRGDVTDPVDVYDAIAAFSPDRVVHLASLLGRSSGADPRAAVEVNVGGTLHVLEAAASVGVDRVVAASSVASYGPSTGETLDETTPQDPRSVYGLTKFAIERLGPTYAARSDLEFAAVEPVHGLGPDRERGNVEDAFVLKAAVAGVPIAVPDVGHPLEVVYVGDEAAAFVDLALADELAHDRYLVGSGERCSLREFAALVRERVPGAEISIDPDLEAGEFTPYPPTDTARLRAETGWRPTHSIAETVDTYATWLESNPDAWSIDPENAPWAT